MDLSDAAQQAIFIRGVDKEFTVTEELLALQPLKRTSIGGDSFNEVQKLFTSFFTTKIISSDEAHFHPSEFVNKQSCRIWTNENLRVIAEKPMHPQRVTVWYGLWAGGIIKNYFFENEVGQAVTVSGIRYREMITAFLWPEIEDIDLDDMWFQQDGATCHTANEAMALLRDKFNGSVISRRGNVNWPPRSCDLTPLDFILWLY